MFIICGGEVEDFGGISHCQQSIKGGLLKIDCKSSAGGEGGGITRILQSSMGDQVNFINQLESSNPPPQVINNDLIPATSLQLE